MILCVTRPAILAKISIHADVFHTVSMPKFRNLEMRYILDTIVSKAYWQYVLFSRSGIESFLAVFGLFYVVVESFDFFNIYTRDKYGKYAFLIVVVLSILVSIIIRRPVRVIAIDIPQQDLQIEVMIGDLFETGGAAMISTNTVFEADVASGKISPNSLQGQFTRKYFTGNQNEVIEQIDIQLKKVVGSAPYPMGTTVQINTHGKTFYFTAMSELNDQGNASSSIEDISQALAGLWKHVHESGELQELAVPVIGMGRGRVNISRKKMIGLIADSFVKASGNKKVGDKLIIVVRPEDAKKSQVNLYDIKEHLVQTLQS